MFLASVCSTPEIWVLNSTLIMISFVYGIYKQLAAECNRQEMRKAFIYIYKKMRSRIKRGGGGRVARRAHRIW